MRERSLGEEGGREAEMLTVGPAELGDGVDEAVVEVGRPAEPGLGVGRQHDARPAAVPVQPQPGAAARGVLGSGGVGVAATAGVVDQAGEHLPCRDLTCTFGGSRRGRPRPKAREGRKVEALFLLAAAVLPRFSPPLLRLLALQSAACLLTADAFGVSFAVVVRIFFFPRREREIPSATLTDGRVATPRAFTVAVEQ